MLLPNDDGSKYIGKEFNKAEVEDIMATNVFKHMQELATAPFGSNTGLSKEEYINKLLKELEEAEKKHHNETEPKKIIATPIEHTRFVEPNPPK